MSFTLLALLLGAVGVTAKVVIEPSSSALGGAPQAKSCVSLPGTYRACGVVLDSDSRPVRMAEVMDVIRAFKVLTDSLGRFSLPLDRGGPVSIRVRAIGFLPSSVDVTSQPGVPWKGIVVLERAPQSLPELSTTSEANSPRANRLADFRARRRKGFGVFRDRTDIDRLAPIYAGDLLKSIPGIRLGFSAGATSVTFSRCRGPGAVVAVWINGNRVRTTDHNIALATIAPSDIEAIEVYRGVAEVPGEFHEDSCAAIVIWTR